MDPTDTDAHPIARGATAHADERLRTRAHTAAPAQRSASPASAGLLAHTGWVYWPLAFIARLPFAMMTVGVLMLVVSATHSVALGGATSAAVGIGVVIAGPVIGDLVDRHGQRLVLVPVGLANGILLALFPLIATEDRPAGVLLAAALAIGLTAPQASAMSRSRLLAIIGARVAPDRRARTTSRMMSYESAADETAFVIGPVLVGVFAALIAPWAPIAIAAALSLGFVTAFALHPTARTSPSGVDAIGTRAPIRDVLSTRILVLVGAASSVGLFFGTTLTSLTAFAQERGAEEQAGLLYGLLGVGSAVLALAVGLLPARFALRRRWIAFALVLTASAIGYATATTLSDVAVWLLVMGLGVGPTLVTLFSLAGERAPLGRTATTLTLLGSALTLAQALSSAFTGWIAQEFSTRAALTLPAMAAALALAFGVVNLVIERRARRTAV
ncbi:MFS transporter [Microbacterium dextranolyticum]|uniref:MFS transporter n=1 Tax=Microbacterium dextranolyticum TaxID=36806 RepID=A0A9W6M5E2_9MICO|nr:MFS transporter [Microbacterium dextranolyticum]MBM7462295.1 MFS family permease [Microbacterium dextranolyticum]GLJ94545.1 MFS transporter [Microbacterium dextranolyticum]